MVLGRGSLYDSSVLFFIYSNPKFYTLLFLFRVQLTNELNTLVQKFSEHYHDAWSQRKQESSWTYGEQTDREQKKHKRLKPYPMLSEFEKETYREPIRYALKALISLGWQVRNISNEILA